MRILLIMSLACILSACQSHQVKPINLSSEQQLQHLSKLEQWDIKGKIAFRQNKNRQNASFTWEQKNNSFTIHLFGPLGQGSTWLKKTKRGVSLETADNNYRQAQTPETLMEELLGWQVPISNLQHWIKGTPADELPVSNILYDELGFITEFEQQGWTIKFPSRQQSEGWLLPKKLVATQGDIKLIIIIKKWALSSS